MYDRLGAQLDRWIRDRNANAAARCEAIAIAAACELDAVISNLASIVLDPNEDLSVRVSAAGRIANRGKPAARRKLRELALGKEKEDPHLLRGHALRACFPDFVSAEELFAHLDMPPAGLHGAYHMFVSSELVAALKTRDLPIALAWVEKILDTGAHYAAFGELGDGILKVAVAYLGTRIIRQAFARVVFNYLCNGREISDELANQWKEWLDSRQHERHQLAWALFDRVKTTDEADYLADRTLPLFAVSDFHLLIARLNRSRSRCARECLSHLILRVSDFRRADHVDAAVVAAKGCRELREFLGDILEAWPLNDERSKKEKERYLERQKRETERNNRRALPDRTEELNACAVKYLAKCESGHQQEWWQLSRLFEYDDHGRLYPQGTWTRRNYLVGNELTTRFARVLLVMR